MSARKCHIWTAKVQIHLRNLTNLVRTFNVRCFSRLNWDKKERLTLARHHRCAGYFGLTYSQKPYNMSTHQPKMSCLRVMCGQRRPRSDYADVSANIDRQLNHWLLKNVSIERKCRDETLFMRGMNLNLRDLRTFEDTFPPDVSQCSDVTVMSKRRRQVSNCIRKPRKGFWKETEKFYGQNKSLTFARNKT